MRLYLICDNSDTATGLRLAGVESSHAETADEVEVKLAELTENSNIGMIHIKEESF